jgi:hypothetical protein
MRFYYCIVLFIAVLGITSCAKREDEVYKLKNEVIGVHDEVMPKMGELRSYQKALLAKQEELQNENTDSVKVQAFGKAAIACDNAYQGMFVWMRQFDAKLEGMNEEESLAYLQDQLVKVTIVNKDIKVALNNAEELLLK